MEPLGRVMCRAVVGVSPRTGAHEAEAVAMASGVDHLLVFDWEHLVGVASLSALRRAAEAATVSDCMVVPVTTISASASVEQAADLMRSTEATCLPVVAGGLILGVVTRDQLDAPCQRH
ncbi:MAG: CBS domain-containing protein [Myxococcales bacterium]